MIHKFNNFLTQFFNILLYPFSFLGDFWEILFLSFLSSLLVLFIYKKVSSPNKIKETKNKIKSSMLAIRLYKDFWRVILSSFLQSLLYTFKYFSLNIGPLLLILPVLFPVFTQMDVRFGKRPFQQGETFILKAKFTEGVESLDVQLKESSHFRALMNPVVIKKLAEIDWKLKVMKDGVSDIVVHVDDKDYKKHCVSGRYKWPVSERKFSHSSFSQILSHFIYPVEKVFTGGGKLKYIHTKYPGKLVSFLGTRIHWIIHYLIWMLVFVLALRKRFGVEF
jgi:hypothetical protein